MRRRAFIGLIGAAAAALGLAIPQTLLVSADRVIE